MTAATNCRIMTLYLIKRPDFDDKNVFSKIGDEDAPGNDLGLKNSPDTDLQIEECTQRKSWSTIIKAQINEHNPTEI